MDIHEFLRRHAIAFERHDHPAVATCDDAARLLPPLPGAATKNLFLRDKSGERHILVIVGHETRVDLVRLAAALGTRKLALASPARLARHLGVEPGSVTVLGLVHDTSRSVEVVFDEPLWLAPAFQFHPLVNTATLILSKEGLVRFLEVTGHAPRILCVPRK